MANPDTPVTPADSQGENQLRQESTQPSSPMTDAEQKTKDGFTNGAGDNGSPVEDVEEMDTKAKALMHLLNTSEVSLPAALCVFEKGYGPKADVL